VIQDHKQKGIALISAVIVSTVLLTIIFTLTAIFIPKLETTREASKSVAALFAAESGAEWCIFIRNKGAIAMPIMLNGAELLDEMGEPLDSGDCSIDPVKIIGEYQGVSRAFELEF